MFKLIDGSKAALFIATTALLMGCGTTATITRAGMPEVEGRIVSSTSQSIYVGTEGSTVEVPRDSITDIDPPGNVAATIGGVVTAYGIANIIIGAPDCDRGGAAYCTGVFLPAAIGIPILFWGASTYSSSVNATNSTDGSKGSFAIVPTVSANKNNEYIGVSAGGTF